MTKPTPHGQVPEALIDLIDAYAETRHRCGGIYNARTEAARNAVIEALSGVQALSAAPADVEDAIAWLVTWKGGEHTYVHAHASELPAVTQARVMGGTVTPCVAALAASPTPPAEQQAAPKAAPGELSADSLRHQNKLLAETLGACILASGIVRKDIDGFTGPELLHFGEDLRSMLEAAPQPAPAPLSEPIDQLERELAIIGVVGAIDGHDVVRRESVLEIARRAALAAQGGK